MKLEKRSSFGWGPTAASYAPCKNGLVVHYDGSCQGLADRTHDSCRAYWRNTRKFHMGASRGWLDIGYSYAVCPHGVVMEGRGWQRQQAAQPGGNSTWTSVTFCSGDGEKPTAAQINAFRELRAWLRGQGLGAAIRGHRDFISTSCPGSILYDMVTSGALTGSPSKEDDDMEPTTKVDIPEYWEGKHFSHPSYSAAFLWAGSLSETRAYGKAILAKLDAQAATIDKLVDALGAAQPDLDALKTEIRQAIESVTVRLDVDEQEEQQS